MLIATIDLFSFCVVLLCINFAIATEKVYITPNLSMVVHFTPNLKNRMFNLPNYTIPFT
jgi:hypothetical protein